MSFEHQLTEVLINDIYINCFGNEFILREKKLYQITELAWSNIINTINILSTNNILFKKYFSITFKYNNSDVGISQHLKPNEKNTIYYKSKDDPNKKIALIDMSYEQLYEVLNILLINIHINYYKKIKHIIKLVEKKL